MFKKYLVASVIFSLLSGCLTSEKVLLYGSGIRKKSKNYTIGETLNAKVGSPLFSGKTLVNKISYESNLDYQPPNAGASNFQSKITKGMKFEVWGRLQRDTSKLIIYNGNFSNGIIIDREGYVHKGWISLSQTLPGAVFAEDEFTKEQLFKFVESVPNKEAFKAEMIFNSLDGNKLNVSYNEYTNPSGKPSKTTDLNFEVSPNKIIDYKDIKIQVLSVSGNEIQYKIISDDGLNWVK
jgi:hypothetical protein